MERLDAPEVLKRIETPLRLTHAGLWAERLARAFWPLWSLAIAALAALAFGLQDHLPLDAFWYGVVSLALGLVWAVVHGARRFRRPSRAEAMARLDARLPGQPLAALADAQALGLGDPASQAVWAAHRARMVARAADARAVAPDLRLSDRDPYALRYVALTALVMALLFGSLWRVVTVAGLVPGGAEAAQTGPTWEGWVQPPAYTGKPALYLADQTGDTLRLPVGSRIQLRFYGEPGGLILSETVSARTDSPPASEMKQEFVVLQSGLLQIEGRGGRDWQVEVIPDGAPVVDVKAEIGREADGRFRQEFSASDDYGVTKGQVVIRLDLAAVDRRFGLAAEPEAIAEMVLDLPMPVRGDRTKFTELLVDDLSKTLLSNQPVTMSYSVTDAAGQVAEAKPLSLTLPGRRFFDPFAAAVIEMRRDLMWSRANGTRVAQVLRAMTYKPEGLLRNTAALERLRATMARLDTGLAAPGLDPALRDEVAEELWQIALMVEEGDLASARDRLRRAQDRLDEAIRNGASPEEIQELMDEMRQALNDLMREMAEEAERNGEQPQQQDGPTIEMSQDQLQQMLDELQRLMEEGKTAEAAELMEQLRQFMENMQLGEGQGGQGQGGPGQQAMRELGETLRDQQGLSDDAFRDLQDGQPGNPEGQQPGEGEGTEGEGQQPGDSLADRQGDLRRQIERLERDGRLPGGSSERGEEGRRQLDRSGEAMREAERALRDGDLPGALDRQAEAMEALREGMREFGEALAEESRREGETRMGDAEGQDDPRAGRDPLGRQTGEGSRIGSDRNMVQEQDIRRRAEELLGEIRRRSGELTRPEGERDYLKRLLDLF